MNGLSPREQARLDHFIGLLLFPALDGPQQWADTNKGIARALLASRVRWSPPDLAFLRSAACGHAFRKSDCGRINRLLDQARETVR